MMVKWSLAGAKAFAREKVDRASAIWFDDFGQRGRQYRHRKMVVSKKGFRTNSLFLLLLMVFMLSLAACSSNSPAVESATLAPTATQASSETPLPSATSTFTSTATPEPTLTSTATPLPPTDTPTPVPPLAVEPDGFHVWCAPLGYEGTRPDGPEAPDYARQLTQQDGRYQVPIPAVYCTIVYQFNQLVPDGLDLVLLDSNTAFLQQELELDQTQTNTAWTTLTHQYVINPPLWEVTYTLTVLQPDGTALWSSPVKFAKPVPEPCPYGGLPDPVTLYCAVTDPWEIEPWPDVEYPYDRSRLP